MLSDFLYLKEIIFLFEKKYWPFNNKFATMVVAKVYLVLKAF